MRYFLFSLFKKEEGARIFEPNMLINGMNQRQSVNDYVNVIVKMWEDCNRYINPSP